MSVVYLPYKTTDASRDIIKKLQLMYYQNILTALDEYKSRVQFESFDKHTFDITLENGIGEEQRTLLEKSINRSIKYYFKRYKTAFTIKANELHDTYLIFKLDDCVVNVGNPAYILIPELGITISTDFDLKSVLTSNCKMYINSKQLIAEIKDDHTIVSH